jgi:hypothetical protein
VRADAVGTGRAPEQGSGGTARPKAQRAGSERRSQAAAVASAAGGAAVGMAEGTSLGVERQSRAEVGGGGAELACGVGWMRWAWVDAAGTGRWRDASAGRAPEAGGAAASAVGVAGYRHERPLPHRDEIFLPHPFNFDRGEGTRCTDVWDPRSHIQ